MHGAIPCKSHLGIHFLLSCFCSIKEAAFFIVSSIISLFFHYFCAGVCAVSSVGPTLQVSTVSGRTTIPTVGHVPVLSLAQCAERTSWRRNCFCSASIVIGGYRSSGCTFAQKKRNNHLPTAHKHKWGWGYLHIFLLLLHTNSTRCLTLCDLKMMHRCVSVCSVGGFTLSVRACTRRMRWNKPPMKALHAHTVPHMFQNLWVSVRI